MEQRRNHQGYRKYFKLANETVTFHNSWDIAKAVLASKFILLNVILTKDWKLII